MQPQQKMKNQDQRREEEDDRKKLIVLGFVGAGAKSYKKGKKSGRAVVSGSSSAAPVMEKLEEGYATLNPDVARHRCFCKISLQGSGRAGKGCKIKTSLRKSISFFCAV